MFIEPIFPSLLIRTVYYQLTIRDMARLNCAIEFKLRHRRRASREEDQANYRYGNNQRFGISTHSILFAFHAAVP
jgi:hypothetical protein